MGWVFREGLPSLALPEGRTIIVLIGGTGLLGSEIAPLLAARGEPVRALVRSGQGTGHLRQLGFELEPGDMRDGRTLRRVLREVRAVISAAQGSPDSRDRSHARVDGAGNQALIDAARAAGVEHFVFVSALKADQAPGVPHLAFKHAAELRLRASGMGYTILRPSSLQETFGGGFAPFKRLVDRFGIGLVPGRGRALHSFVAAHDVARAAVLALDHPAARDAVVEIGGPANLSYREAYRRITRVTGRRIHTVPIPGLGAAGSVTGVLAPEMGGLLRLLAFQERAGYTCVTPDWLVEALLRRRTFDEGMRLMYGEDRVAGEGKALP
jgi:uncharacterized protein YbjT (DUF2867 family)